MSTPPKRKLLVFVCTGNTCRSPMAEALLRADARLPDHWDVSSAGLHSGVGSFPSRGSVAAVREKGIDLSGHRTRPMTDALAASAALLVAMTAAHAAELRVRFPHAAKRVRRLADFAPDRRDIGDPFGLPLQAYRECRDDILAAFPRLLESLV